MDWRTLPSLSALRAFAALAETGSFSAAGQALSVSHAAVSQQVRALEERLGVALVTRQGRRASLTPEGKRLAGALEEAFLTVRRAVDELTGADLTRPLHVTTTQSFASSWLMPRLSEFRQEHPRVELMIQPTVEVMDLSPGGVDVAIRYGRGRWPGLESTLLLPTSFVMAASTKLVGDRCITEPADLLDLPWLQELGTDEVSVWLRSRGVDAPARASITHLPGHLVLQGLLNGDGVSPTARELVERDIEEGRLVVLFEEDGTEQGYYIVTRPGVMRPPLKAFVAWLKRHARSRPA
jgi:LysR family glycine cleavage system transcriptional activator